MSGSDVKSEANRVTPVYAMSTCLKPEQGLDATLEQIAAGGFGEVEIGCSDPSYVEAMTPRTDDIARKLRSLGLTCRVGHAPCIDVDLGSLDETHRQESLQWYERSFELFSRLSVEFLIVHPNAWRTDYSDANRDGTRTQTVLSLQRLARRSGDLGIKMAVENLQSLGLPRPGCSIADNLDMIEGLGDHVGLCLDTAHACWSGHVPADEVHVAGRKLFTLHIVDTDGHSDPHWIPGRGVIDWESFLDALEEIGFAGPRTLELEAIDDPPARVIGAALALAQRWQQRKDAS
jgi:sugar phosphate isomerase/epimerase